MEKAGVEASPHSVADEATASAAPPTSAEEAQETIAAEAEAPVQKGNESKARATLPQNSASNAFETCDNIGRHRAGGRFAGAGAILCRHRCREAPKAGAVSSARDLRSSLKRVLPGLPEKNPENCRYLF